jgi:cysteine desulfurase
VRIYLDHNATTPLAGEVRAAIHTALDLVGNPSSIHAEGRAARHTVEKARRHVADLLGASTDEIVFTSGGTEADCLGVIGLAGLAGAQGRPRRVVTTAIEHPAVQGAASQLEGQGFELVRVAVDGRGVMDMAGLEAACAAGAAVVALSLANHELGTIQDVAGAAAMAHQHGALIHCDAVQAAGKRAVSVAALGVDSLALSAHKFHGPKGVGALWIRRGLDLSPLCPAGHQERERRPGTENVPAIAGMGEAARLAAAELAAASPATARVARLAATLEQGLMALDRVRIHGAGAPRVGNTVNAGFEGALGEAVVAALDLCGFAASTGAACTSGSVAPSPVLLGIGLSPERAVEAVRFSLGPDNTEEHIQALLEVLPDILVRARQFR